MPSHKSVIAPLALVGLTLLSGALLSSSLVSADDSVVDEINITVPVSCTLSGTGMNTHNAEISNGTYNSAIGETTIKAFCNDANGFAIYAIGYTDNTNGKNVLTNSTLGDTYDIVTGTATGPVGNVDSSQWAMKLSTITDPAPTYPIIIAGSSADTDKEQGDPDYTSFQEVPDDYTLVAKRTSGTDINPSGQSTAEGATFKTTYQAYISKTQPAGTYTGQVKYTLVHPHDGTAPELPSKSFDDAFSDAGKVKLNGYYKMQDISSSICSTVTYYDEESQTQLIDARDNKIYWVAKMRDDNCWMTQNLDFDIGWDDILTNENTDIGWNQSTNSYNSTTITVEDMADGVSNPGDLIWDGIIASDTTKTRSAIVDATELHYHLGNYYSWDTAVASNDPTPQESSSNSPDQSICPAYWTLPSVADYDQLFSTYFDTQYSYGIDDWDTLMSVIGAPFYFMPSGDESMYPAEIGSRGGYWTNEVYGISEFSFHISFDYLDEAEREGLMYVSDANRFYTRSVRCRAR